MVRTSGSCTSPRRAPHCSIVVGKGIGTAAPGSAENVHLIVRDIEEARADLVGRGVEVSEIFHDADGVFHHAGDEKRVPGLYPGRLSYGSFASFSDPRRQRLPAAGSHRALPPAAEARRMDAADR